MIPDAIETQQARGLLDTMVAELERDFGGFCRDMNPGPHATLADELNRYLLNEDLKKENPEDIGLGHDFVIVGHRGTGKSSLLNIFFGEAKRFTSAQEAPVLMLSRMIGNDLKATRALHDDIYEFLWKSLFCFGNHCKIKIIEGQHNIAEIALLKLFTLWKWIAAIIARLRLLLFVRYMFNRRFRNGRRSRRLLLHHAYQISYLSLSVLHSEACLAIPSGVREQNKSR